MPIAIAASIVPVLGIFLWLYFRDRLREPPLVVIVTFVLGIVTAGPAILLEDGIVRLGTSWGIVDPAGMRTLAHAGFTAFAVAALVEELLKFAVLWGYSARRDAFDEPMDGIVYGAAASLGFAGIENVLYVVGAGAGEGGSVAGSMSVAVLRAFTAVPMHAACGVVMGACIGVARFTPRRRALWMALGIGGAIGLHGFYNFAAMSSGAMDAQDSGIGVGVGVLAMVGGLAAAVMVAVLALARLRRDQEVAIAVASGAPGLPPVHAPRLPMATGILAAATAACAVVALAAGVAVARGQQQAEPLAEGHQAAIGVLVGATVLAGLALAAATVVTGIVSLVRQRRWRAVTVVSMLVGAGLGVVYVGLSVMVAVGVAGTEAGAASG